MCTPRGKQLFWKYFFWFFLYSTWRITNTIYVSSHIFLRKNSRNSWFNLYFIFFDGGVVSHFARENIFVFSKKKKYSHAHLFQFSIEFISISRGYRGLKICFSVKNLKIFVFSKISWVPECLMRWECKKTINKNFWHPAGSNPGVEIGRC